MSENVNQENKQEQENTDTPETQPQQEPSPETAEETFTVTRDQMEKMEQLAKMVSDWQRNTTTTANAPPRKRRVCTATPRPTP